MKEKFVTSSEQLLSDQFMSEGYVNLPVDDLVALQRLQKQTAVVAANQLAQPEPEEPGVFLDNISDQVSVKNINEWSEDQTICG